MSNCYLILKSGYIPEDWVIGIIVPIYKNKGSAVDPCNYRGISLLSCMCKLFTSVLSQNYIDLLKMLRYLELSKLALGKIILQLITYLS